MAFSLTFPQTDVPFLQDIRSSALDTGIEAYLVGGYLRDILLEKGSKDIDIMCLGPEAGLRLAKTVATRWGNKAKSSFFKRFGTAQLKYEGYVFEFVGARKESYNSDSRQPLVLEGTLEEDMARRDFRCNALAFALKNFPKGALIDLFDGVSDLKRGCLRTPLLPNQTFSDDPLRMMRAVRFAAQLNFEIHPETLQSMRTCAERLSIVSQERITTEFNQLIMSKAPAHGLLFMLETDLLEHVLPELLALKGTERIGRHTHKDNFFHTLKVLENIVQMGANLWLRWAALLHDIAKPKTKHFDPTTGWSFHGHEDLGARMVPSIFRRLRLPLDRVKYVKKLVKLHLRPIALVSEQASDSALRRLLYEAGDDIEDLMLLVRADITSKDDRRVHTYLRNFDRVEQKMKVVEAKDKVRNFRSPLSGEQLMEIFGLPPGPLVGELKRDIKNAILAGKVPNTAKDSYDFLCSLAKEKGIRPLPGKSNIFAQNTENS